MTNDDAHHTLCAIALWKAEMHAEQLEMENMALRGELERLKKKADTPKERPHAVPDPA